MWLERGGDAKGRSLWSVSRRERHMSKRANGGFVKKVLMCRSERTEASRERVLCVKNSRVLEAACTEKLRGRSGSRASRREGRRGDAGASDGPCSHKRLDTFAGAQDLDFGLVWRTGQAWNCTLDLERDQLRPIFDPARGQSARRPRTRCLEGAGVLRRHFLPRGTFEREFEPVDTRFFVTSTIRAS